MRVFISPVRFFSDSERLDKSTVAAKSLMRAKRLLPKQFRELTRRFCEGRFWLGSQVGTAAKPASDAKPRQVRVSADFRLWERTSRIGSDWKRLPQLAIRCSLFAFRLTLKTTTDNRRGKTAQFVRQRFQSLCDR
jgi:hypothetical protein